MTVMEPRLAERRKGVKEDRARGRLKWVIIAIVFIGTVLAGLWLIRSPVLSIRDVAITGSDQSDPGAIVAEIGMGHGTPTIDVDVATISAAIEADPWVASAAVDVSWPGGLSIAVTEHVPIASILAADGWVQAALDGSVVPGSGLLADAPKIEIDTGPVSAGYAIANPLIIGALEFVEALPVDLASDATVGTDGEGLVAVVGGHEIIIGRPVDLATKATVVATILDTELVDGAVINVIAPLRPAVTNPQPLLEGEE